MTAAAFCTSSYVPCATSTTMPSWLQPLALPPLHQSLEVALVAFTGLFNGVVVASSRPVEAMT